MPPERQGTQKRRRLPFNPPRPRDTITAAGPSASALASSTKAKPPSKAAKNTANATASSSKGARKPTGGSTAASSSRQKASGRPSAAASDSGSESQSGSEGSESGSQDRERSPSEEPDYILAEITNNDEADDVMSSEPAIPPKLLTRLLHHHFKSEKTKIAKDANEVVSKYVDVFVREALARAAYERAEGLADRPGGISIGDGFLEVEDLEKMAPQLALDF
ncbi:ADP-ribose 1''-phosphate phosphatase [Aspergillus udagawae]|nr:ADP-ribose 1''-phosphate phosphatase [Aspergillus udagawae]